MEGNSNGPVSPFALGLIRDRTLGWEKEGAPYAGFREGQERQKGNRGVSCSTDEPGCGDSPSLWMAC